MLYGFSYEEHEHKKDELDWMRHNSERVQHLFDGVNTHDGESGCGAVAQTLLRDQRA